MNNQPDSLRDLITEAIESSDIYQISLDEALEDEENVKNLVDELLFLISEDRKRRLEDIEHYLDSQLKGIDEITFPSAINDLVAKVVYKEGYNAGIKAIKAFIRSKL